MILLYILVFFLVFLFWGLYFYSNTDSYSEWLKWSVGLSISNLLGIYVAIQALKWVVGAIASI